MKEIHEAASSKADSFFIEMAKKQTFDSSRIPKPIKRPLKPLVEILEDSLPLRPMLSDSTNQTAQPSDTLR